MPETTATKLSPEKESSALNGLVLCGGASSRMGTPKGLMQYHSRPQFLHAAELLKDFCTRIIISSNIELSAYAAHELVFIKDSDKYKNAGPIGGVLSAIDAFPNQSLMVIGCDYPGLTRLTIGQLVNEADVNVDAVCFQGPDAKNPEPLIAIYHHSCFGNMERYFTSGGQSLKTFLLQIRTRMIVPDDISELRSYDTHEDFLSFNKQ